MVLLLVEQVQRISVDSPICYLNSLQVSILCHKTLIYLITNISALEHKCDSSYNSYWAKNVCFVKPII